jgi:hypothetical protein
VALVRKARPLVHQLTQAYSVIMIQAENEFTEGSTKSPYMQQIIDLYRANGVVIRKISTP